MAPISISRKAAAIGLAFAASAIFVAPAAAQEGSVIRSIFGAIGIAGPERPAIEYRERAPLVVPPGRDLPPPVAPDALSGNPQWPDDPTLRAGQSRVTGQSLSNDASPPMTIEEIRAGRRAGVQGGTSFIAMDDDAIARPLSREELLINPFENNDSQGLTRRFLTDPPNALLQQVPSN